MKILITRSVKIVFTNDLNNILKRLSIIVIVFCVPLFGVQAAEFDESPTFSNEVVRVLQEKCQRCHQPGGIGPMPLETYAQASAWAPRVQE